MKWFSIKNHENRQSIQQNTQGYCQPTKESICYNLPLHTHDEEHYYKLTKEQIK